MKIIEVGTGYTSIPANMGAATEIVVEELVKSFCKQEINVEIFDIKDENRKENKLPIKEVYVPKIFRKKDVSLGIMHKLKRVIYSISLANALKKEIKKSEEQIAIHFHNQYNMFFFSKLVPKKIRSKAKIFYTVHSYIWSDKWENIEDTVNKRYFQEVFSVQNSDKVFVLNEITKKHFIEKLNVKEEKIKIIDNGVNTDVYMPKENNSKDFIFFQSGSVCDRKNQLESIDKLSKYMKENKNIKYMYAGGIIEQEYKEKIDELIKKNNIENQVEYLGELSPGEELSKCYNSSKAFIFPSKSESFGMVIIEAMASGLPVIMNNKEILKILYKLKDVILFYDNDQEFDSIMHEKILNEEERIRIGKESRKVIEKEYSWDVVAKRYYEEFK